MTSNKLEFFNRTSQNFSSFLGYILMAGPVSSVLADLVFSVIFSRNRIAISFFRHSCMERGVKDYHAGNVWQNFSKSTDACSVGWIMQWSQKRQLLYLLNHFFINEGWILKVFTASHNTMAHTGNLIIRFNDIKAFQIIQQNFYGLRVICNIKNLLLWTTVKFHCWNRILETNPFQQALSQDLFFRHQVELPF